MKKRLNQVCGSPWNATLSGGVSHLFEVSALISTRLAMSCLLVLLSLIFGSDTSYYLAPHMVLASQQVVTA